MTVRVALDLLGGDDAPDVTAAGARDALRAHQELRLVLVGPAAAAAAVLADPAVAGRATHVLAERAVGMGEDALRAVRARRDATVRVCCRLLRDGDVDAVVSCGPTGATVAAAAFALPRLAGVSRPALAVMLPERCGGAVLLDVGATLEASPGLLVQHALSGTAYARARGSADPRVGLLTVGAEPRKGDRVRAASYDALAELPLRFVGGVEPAAVLDGAVDVAVTDGFTGNLVLKTLEAAHRGSDARPAGGATLLGLDGLVVVGHGASTAEGVAAAIDHARQAAREQVVAGVAAAMAELVARRRRAAGLPHVAGACGAGGGQLTGDTTTGTR